MVIGLFKNFQTKMSKEDENLTTIILEWKEITEKRTVQPRNRTQLHFGPVAVALVLDVGVSLFHRLFFEEGLLMKLLLSGFSNYK
jgi:hypothetical protein